MKVENNVLPWKDRGEVAAYVAPTNFIIENKTDEQILFVDPYGDVDTIDPHFTFSTSIPMTALGIYLLAVHTACSQRDVRLEIDWDVQYPENFKVQVRL